jgi:hypothetical protein
MSKFLIERKLPAPGKRPNHDLRIVSQKSRGLLSAFLLLPLILAGYGPVAHSGERAAHEQSATHTFIIERNIEGAGKLSPEELRDISRKSRDVLQSLGPSIQWVQSYVVDDKIYCVYTAPNKEIIRRHAEQGGFPANRISEVHNVISLKTAE